MHFTGGERHKNRRVEAINCGGVNIDFPGEEAKIHLSKLQAKEVAGYEDLYMDAAETCWAVGRVGEAEVMYTALREVEVYDQPALWAKIAGCIRARIGESSSDAAFTTRAAADGVIEFYKSAGDVCLFIRSSFSRGVCYPGVFRGWGTKF